jgi:hypothetical protein
MRRQFDRLRPHAGVFILGGRQLTQLDRLTPNSAARRTSASARRAPAYTSLPRLRVAYEIKHDRFRFICRRENERVRVFSRRGLNRSRTTDRGRAESVAGVVGGHRRRGGARGPHFPVPEGPPEASTLIRISRRSRLLRGLQARA